jgi:hypothetical protein
VELRFLRFREVMMALLTFSGSRLFQQWGTKPGVATSGEVDVVAEVHQDTGGVGPLSYRAGPLVVFPVEAPRVYESSGFEPKLASDNGIVVEVHSALSGAVGPLWYRVGHWSGFVLTWDNSYKFEDTGCAPSVGIGSSRVIEVHVGADGLGPLWWRTGTIGASGPITFGSSNEFMPGSSPAVAVSPDGSTAALIFVNNLVHLSFALANWSPASGFYWGPGELDLGVGLFPAIAVAPPHGSNTSPTIIEVHQQDNNDGSGPLMWRTATLTPSGPTWDSAPTQYDVGACPAIAVYNDGSGGIVVHQENVLGGSLYYRTFTIS